MNKLLALLGGTALAAAVIPYAYQKNESTNEKTIQALLWKATIADDDKKLALSVGFNNPFQPQKNDLFADNLTVNYHTAPSCEVDPDADCYADEEADCEADCGCCCQAEETPCCCENTAEESPCCCQNCGDTEDEEAQPTDEPIEEPAEGPIEAPAEGQ